MNLDPSMGIALNKTEAAVLARAEGLLRHLARYPETYAGADAAAKAVAGVRAVVEKTPEPKGK